MLLEKIIIGILIAFIFISITLNGILFFQKRSSDRLISEHRNSIIIFEKSIAEQKERNVEIKELNIKIKLKLEDSIRRGNSAEKVVGEISIGLSKDISTIDDIIEAIKKIKQSIEQYSISEESINRVHNDN